MRNSVRWCLGHLRANVALVQLAGVVACLPPLIFPTFVPQWAIYGSLAGLALLPVIGYALVGRPVARTPVDFPIWLLLLILPFNLLVTKDPSLTLPHVYKIVGSAALFYGVVGILEEKRWFGLSALTIGGLGLVLGGILLFGTHWSSMKFPWLPFNLSRFVPLLVNPFWKPEGFAGFNANLAGGTLALLLPVPTAYLLFGRRPLIRLGALLEAVTLSLLLLFTQSRGAITGLAAGVAAMLIGRDRRWLAVIVALLVGGGLTLRLTGVEIAPPPAVDTVEGAVQSLEGRVELWSRGWMMLRDFPFTGVGLGMVVEMLPLLYPTFVVPPDAGVEHLHNVYLQTGAELGFPGLIATLALLLGLLHLCRRAAQRASGTELEPLALGMLGMVVVFAAHGLTETIPMAPKAHLIIWALFGVAAALGMHLVRQDGSPSPPASQDHPDA